MIDNTKTPKYPDDEDNDESSELEVRSTGPDTQTYLDVKTGELFDVTEQSSEGGVVYDDGTEIHTVIDKKTIRRR